MYVKLLFKIKWHIPLGKNIKIINFQLVPMEYSKPRTYSISISATSHVKYCSAKGVPSFLHTLLHDNIARVRIWMWRCCGCLLWCKFWYETVTEQQMGKKTFIFRYIVTLARIQRIEIQKMFYSCHKVMEKVLTASHMQI